MNLTLQRKLISEYGVFGALLDQYGARTCFTLEHNFGCGPKLAAGSYTCRRGRHRLASMTQDFETFEILGVPPFQNKPVSGILFHQGNFNQDSEGCVLLGVQANSTMILQSHVAFESFLSRQAGLDQFQLTVLDVPS